MDAHDLLQPLATAPTQVWFDNRLQLHHVLEHCLVDIGGAADVVITTFSISEEFIRKMFVLKKRNLIRKATLVADRKAMRKLLNLLHFVNNTFDEVYLCDTHAKVLLLTTATHQVSITTSQNQTRGNRYEAGIISTDPSIYAYYTETISHIINTQTIALYELFD